MLDRATKIVGCQPIAQCQPQLPLQPQLGPRIVGGGN